MTMISRGLVRPFPGTADGGAGIAGGGWGAEAARRKRVFALCSVRACGIGNQSWEKEASSPCALGPTCQGRYSYMVCWLAGGDETWTGERHHEERKRLCCSRACVVSHASTEFLNRNAGPGCRCGFHRTIGFQFGMKARRHCFYSCLAVLPQNGICRTMIGEMKNVKISFNDVSSEFIDIKYIDVTPY